MTSQRRHRNVPHMKLWELTIVIVGLIWVIGTILVAAGATWLVRHQPH